MPVIGIAELLVQPSFRGTQQAVSREVGRIMPRAGRNAGQQLGRGMAEGLASETAGLEAEVERLGRTVSQAETSVAASREKMGKAAVAESKALGELRVAELKLQEVRENSNARASQIAAAEERLQIVRTRAAEATTRRETAESSLSRATTELGTAQERSSRASVDLETNMRRVAEESENTERSVGRLGARLRSAFNSSPLAGLVSGIRRDTNIVSVDLHQMAQNVSQQGTRGGRAFTQGFITAIGGLSAITPTIGAVSASLLAAVGAATTFAGSLSVLGGVAALIPAGMIAIGASVGVLKAAFAGVGEALKAVTDQKGTFAADPRLQAMAVEDASRAIIAAEENAARAQEGAARRVTDAKRALTDTIAAVADAEESAAEAIEAASRRVVDAKRSLEDAIRSAARTEEDSAEAQVDAARRVRDAKLGLQDTIERVAEAQQSAARAVETAERRQAEATRDVVAAQKALEEARTKANARVAETDKGRAEADRKAMDTAAAYRNVVDAYNKAKADPNASLTQLAQLEYNMAKALENNEAAKQAAIALAKEHKIAQDAAKKGGDAVLSAEEKLANARQAEADALQARKDAEAKVLKQQRDGARQIADAQERITDAIKDQKRSHEDAARSGEDAARRISDAQQGVTDSIQDEKDARAEAVKVAEDGSRRIADAQLAISDASKDAKQVQIDSARAVEQAQRNLERVHMQQADAAKQAGHASSQAMDDLTPAARTAVRALLTVKDQLSGIRRIAQENFFTGFAAPLLSLSSTIMPQLATGVGAIASAFGAGAQIFMGALENALGGGVLESLLMGVADTVTVLNKAITPFVDSFVTLGVVGMKYMPRLAAAIGDIATRFNDFIQVNAASGQLDVWIEQGIQGFKDLGSILSSTFGIFGALNDAAVAGGVATTLGGMADALNRVETMMQGEVFQTTMTTIFAGAAAGAAGLGKAFDQIGAAFVRGAPALAEFLRLGGEIAGVFIGGVFTALSDPALGAGLNSFLGDLLNGVKAMEPLLPGLTGAFGALLAAIGPLVEKLGPTLVEVFTGFGNGLAFVVEMLSPLLTLLADSPIILGLVIAAFVGTTAASAALTLAGNVQRIAMGAWKVATVAWSVVTGAAAVAQGIFTAAMGRGARSILGNKMALIGYRVAMAAGAAATGIATAATWLFNGALRGIGGAVKAIPVIGWIITAITLLTGALVWFFTKTEMGQKIWGGFMNGIKDAAQGISTWFTGTFIPGFHKIFADLPGWLADVGKNLMLGLLNGITGGNGQKVLDAFTGFVTGVIDWVKKLFGIHSPSTVFADIGGFLLQGLANGVMAYIGLVTAAFKAVWEGIRAVISFAWETLIKPIFAAISTWVTVTLPKAFNDFKALIGVVWTAIKTSISTSWDSVKGFFTAINNWIRITLKNTFNWFRDSVITPVWNTIKNKISGAWDGIKGTFNAVRNFLRDTLGPVFTWFKDKVIAPVWDGITSIIKGVWKNGIKPIFDIIMQVLKGDFPGAFKTAKDAIERIWNGIKAVTKKPISFVINTVLNKGLIGAFNKVAGWIPGVKKLDEVKIKGFARGGWTGPGSKYQEAGIVHADEFVVRKESQRSIARKAPGFLDSLNRFGAKALGYANGGLVHPMDPRNRGVSAGWHGYPGHKGTDYPAPVGTPVYSPGPGTVAQTGWNLPGGTGKQVWINHDNGLLSRVHHLSQWLVKAGQRVGAGQAIGKVGMTGNTTGPHAHWGVMDGGKYLNPASIWGSGASGSGDFFGGGGGGFDPMSAFSGLTEKVGTWFSEKFPAGGQMVAMAKGIGGKLIGDVKDWAVGKLSGIGDFTSDVVRNISGNSPKQQVRGVAEHYGWSKGNQWASLNELVRRESSWNPNAANPRSSARGLFQKMTSLHGPIEATADGQAKWGLNYIKERYGNPQNAIDFHDRNGHYADGGLVSPTAMLHDQGGQLMPGLSLLMNKTGKPEPVLNQQQWADISKLAARGMEMSFPESMVLQVGEHEFTAHLKRVVDSRTAQNVRGMRQVQRQTTGIGN